MIVTFYSFKGGSGKSMALANIAVRLAQAKKSVLAVDFDLESPGLRRFFQADQPNLEDQAGLLDMVRDQLRRPPGEFADWRAYVTPLSFESGSISFMTSGKTAGYSDRLYKFTLTDLYRQARGADLVKRIRSQWSDAYDHVLIDSHIGFTHGAGICTIALPDLIVPVFMANTQSVEGTVDVLRRVQEARRIFPYDRPPVLVLPVLSRFDAGTERETADRWLNVLAEKFDPYYAGWLPTGIPARTMLERTKLPYNVHFSCGEKLAVLCDGTADPDSLGSALNSLAWLIETELRAAAAVAGGLKSLAAS